MNNRVVYNLHYTFHRMGFTVMRFNFRMSAAARRIRSGIGELSDAASALDYLRAMNPNSSIAGRGLQLRRLDRDAASDAPPRDHRFISVAPPANLYDFSFLAPCPSSGLIVNGTADRVAPPKDTAALVAKLREQKGITITHDEIEGADHFFRDDEVQYEADDRHGADLCPPPPDRDDALRRSNGACYGSPLDLLFGVGAALLSALSDVRHLSSQLSRLAAHPNKPVVDRSFVAPSWGSGPWPHSCGIFGLAADDARRAWTRFCS